MPHFVLSHRRAGRTHPDQHTQAIESLDSAIHQTRTQADLLHSHRPEGSGPIRHVAVLESEAGALDPHARHPDLIVEPLIEHHLGRARQADSGRPHGQQTMPTIAAGHDQLPVQVSDDQNRPLQGIDVFADFGSGRNRKQSVSITDAHGQASIGLDPQAPIHELAVAPAAQWWPVVFESPSGELAVRLMPLPEADHYLGWWHQHSGINHWSPDRGQGMRIGVIDSGLGSHTALQAVKNAGSIVNCQLDPDGGNDPRGHGTHVCGAIAARPTDPRQFGGIAPGALVHAVRVFGDSGSAHQADIALALHFMAHDQRCHLVNLSLGTTERSELVADAVTDAREAGCLTICATGNGNDAVEYPAALPDSIAVGAVGLDGWGPSGSLAAHRKPDEPARCAEPWFIANFSSHGPEVNAVAPGVGIISTVPDDQYAAYSGTSMATPQLTGLLAAALADHNAVLEQSGLDRIRTMEKVLGSVLTDLGLAAELQGRGRIVLG